MPTRLTVFRFGAALVIGLAFALWPRDSAYAISLFLFLLGSGAGFVEDVLARRVGEAPSALPMRQAAHRVLTLCALVGVLLAEPESAALIVPPLLAVLFRDAATWPLREALAHRGARLRPSRLALLRTRLEFLAITALLSGPVLDGPADSPLQPLGLVLLWAAMAVTVWDGWRECGAALNHLRRAGADGSRARGREEPTLGAAAVPSDEEFVRLATPSRGRAKE